MGQNYDKPLQRSIEASKAHWSEVRSEWDSDSGYFDIWKGYTDREVFETLRNLRDYEKWLCFAEDVESPDDLVMGQKLAEGGQAEIFEVRDCRKKMIDHRYVLKVFKKGYSIRDLYRQWPEGLRIFPSFRMHIVRGAMMLQDDRFAFLLKRGDIDLRKLIDIAQERNSPLFKGKVRKPLRSFATYEPKLQHQGCSGPIFRAKFVRRIMLHIAHAMYYLHDIGVFHRDLKASNILCTDSKNHTLRSTKSGYEERCIDIDVVDFESSQGVVGTGFWRAPEILQQLKDGISRVNFTPKADVYSYAMVFYEVLSGRLPFDEYKWSDYDHVLDGARPTLPDYVPLWMRDLIHKCWHQDPSERPTFYRIWCEIGSHSDDERFGSNILVDSYDCRIILEKPDEVFYPITTTTEENIINYMVTTDAPSMFEVLLEVLLNSLLLKAWMYVGKYFYPETPFWKLKCSGLILSIFLSKIGKLLN